MMWTNFALLLCGIAEAFQKPTVESIDSDKKDTVFIATPSTQVFSHLRDILNQESLVRLSMVQKMQSMAMDLVDVKNKVETLTDNLKKVTEELRTTKAENQKQQKEIADLEKARENLSEEFRKLNTTQADESNEVETLTKNLKMITDELHTNQKEITDLKNLSEEFRQIKTTQADEINALKNITSEIQSGIFPSKTFSLSELLSYFLFPQIEINFFIHNSYTKLLYFLFGFRKRNSL